MIGLTTTPAWQALRRLAALVSFPYSHQVRYHGVFAGRSRLRRSLPAPPSRQEELEVQAPVVVTGTGGSRETGATEQVSSTGHRRRMPWAQLLRRVLHLDALSCPRCSRRKQSVPMVVLAFLTDPDVVGKILKHLGLPTCAPVLAPTGSVSSPQQLMQQEAAFSDAADGDPWPDGGVVSDRGMDQGSSATSRPNIRPPPWDSWGTGRGEGSGFSYCLAGPRTMRSTGGSS